MEKQEYSVLLMEMQKSIIQPLRRRKSVIRCRVQLFATPWTVACQVPLSVEFSRQEYCSGLPCPSLRNLPDPGVECGPPASQADSLPSEPGKSYRRKQEYLGYVYKHFFLDSAILLSGTYYKDILAKIRKDVCIWLLTPGIFLIPKDWKQYLLLVRE